MDRAYSLLEIKQVDEDARVITGIASTPITDRVGDIVEPKGAEFKLPIPLLWQHRHDAPIGEVTRAKVTASGITVEAKIARVDEAGTLKDRLDEAWQSIKAGLVRGFSIGFKPLETADIDGSFGQRFIRWLWLELSTVTVPANADATIQTVKSVDHELRAASGREQIVARENPAGASASLKVKIRPKEATKMKTIAEQISAFEASRMAKSAEMDALMDAVGEKGETLDAAGKEKYDGLAAEVKEIDEHLVRLRDTEKRKATTATVVNKIETAEKAADSRGDRTTVVTAMKDSLPKGIEFARYVMCLATAKGDPSGALHVAQARYPDQARIHNVLKAAVAAGTTTDSSWAGNLVDYTHFSGDFIEYLRPMTLVGRIPGLRRVPFNIQIPRQTGAGAAYWVGEGAPKPVTSFAFDNVQLRWAKIAAISVLTQELVRFSNPSAEALVRDSLAAAIVERMDIDFVDPSKAEVSNVSPASITNGVTAIASSGTDAEAVRSDIRAVMQSFINSNLRVSRGVWLMSESNALGASLMLNALGQPEFPGVTADGGTLQGRPVITSQYLGGIVIYFIPEEVYLSDDGQVVIDASREASLQMDSAPTNSSATPTATTVVSMFQTNSIALRAERIINWKRRRDTAVAWLDDVDWGTSSGSDA